MSANHYWSGLNTTPGVHGGGGSIYRGGNNITVRGNEVLEALPSQKRSKNMADASIKVLRFYKKACRLIPFILRIHNMQSKVSVVGAKQNLANVVRQKAHYRDPHLVDDTVGRAYEMLIEAEQHFTQHTLLYQFLCPPWKAMNDRGYSYLERVKFENKTKFLQDFYSSPNTY